MQAAKKLSLAGVEPGDADWTYCDRPLSTELATGLAKVWPGLETVYLHTLGEVFRDLRTERELICHYFYNKRYV